MTFIDLLFVIVGIVLGFLFAPVVIPHLTGQTTIGLVLTYFLALLTGIGIWIGSIMLRVGLQQITHKPKRK